ncbi:MAG: hypothetical protein ACPGTO_05005 [Polaribacter sp.]
MKNIKKIVSILVVVFAFTLVAQAQKRGKKMKGSELSVEQQTTLAVKKLTLALDLTDAQQRQIRSLIATKITDRKAHFKKMKVAKKEGKKLSADERYAKVNEHLDKEIAMQNNMKRILNDEQYAKFKKMKKGRMGKMKKYRMKKIKTKKKKELKQKEHEN